VWGGNFFRELEIFLRNFSENFFEIIFRNPIENFARPNAQKVSQLLRYEFTGISGEVGDRPGPERRAFSCPGLRFLKLQTIPRTLPGECENVQQ